MCFKPSPPAFLAALNIFELSYFTLLSSNSSTYSFNHITFLNNIYIDSFIIYHIIAYNYFKYV